MSPDDGERGKQSGGDLALQRGRILYCPSHHIGRVFVGGVGWGEGRLLEIVKCECRYRYGCGSNHHSELIVAIVISLY